jgi:nucleoside 2-deoxyribosyltransferase
LIRWIAENVEGPGEVVFVRPATHRSIIGAKTDEGFGLVLKHLFDVGLVEGDLTEGFETPAQAYATLSFNGWDYYEKLRQGGATYRKGFIAMKFGDTMLDKLLTESLKPCAKQAGFELLRLDDTPKAGLIDDRLRVEIQSSDFLVADLTHDNPGAYWEAGYAEGLGKPVICFCEKDKFEIAKTHFDTNHHLTIVWDKENLPKAGQDLKATIRATLPHLAKQEDKAT